MILLDNEEMVTDAMVPAPLAAGLMYLSTIYCAQGREISSWSQGRLKEGEAGARPGRGGGEGASPEN